MRARRRRGRGVPDGRIGGGRCVSDRRRFGGRRGKGDLNEKQRGQKTARDVGLMFHNWFSSGLINFEP
jgi:hypothetical protein